MGELGLVFLAAALGAPALVDHGTQEQSADRDREHQQLELRDDMRVVAAHLDGRDHARAGVATMPQVAPISPWRSAIQMRGRKRT